MKIKQVTRVFGVLFTLLLWRSLSYANMFAQWGVASAHPSQNRSAIKFAEIGATGEQGKLAYTVGLGGWMDRSGYVGKGPYEYGKEKASDSGFVEALFGVDPQIGIGYMTYKLGPAIVFKTDSLLGSNIQVAHELGFGIRDKRGVKVGIVLKHFSNAGLVQPNVGRDFVGLRIEF